MELRFRHFLLDHTLPSILVNLQKVFITISVVFLSLFSKVISSNNTYPPHYIQRLPEKVGKTTWSATSLILRLLKTCHFIAPSAANAKTCKNHQIYAKISHGDKKVNPGVNQFISPSPPSSVANAMT